MPAWATLVTLVTRSTAAVPRARKPTLVAPAGAAKLELSVRPATRAAGMLAVIFAVLWLVVTAQVAVASVTLVGAEPATAVVMVSDGAPVKATLLIALTANST